MFGLPVCRGRGSQVVIVEESSRRSANVGIRRRTPSTWLAEEERLKLGSAAPPPLGTVADDRYGALRGRFEPSQGWGLSLATSGDFEMAIDMVAEKDDPKRSRDG